MDMFQGVVLSVLAGSLIYFAIIKNPFHPTKGAEANIGTWISVPLLLCSLGYVYYSFAHTPEILENRRETHFRPEGESWTLYLPAGRIELTDAEKKDLLLELQLQDSNIETFDVELVEYKITRQYFPVNGFFDFFEVEAIYKGPAKIKDIDNPEERAVKMIAFCSSKELEHWIEAVEQGSVLGAGTRRGAIVVNVMELPGILKP